MRWSSFATAALWSLLGVSVAYSQAFTYQGFLRVNGTPATGSFNMRFSLYDASTGGTQQGATVTLNNVSVVNGLFTVALNFGGLTLWDGSPRWLQIEVADPPSSTNYVPIQPRVEIRPTPYSFFAYRSLWGGLIDVPAGFADGIDNDTTYSAGAGLQLTDTTFSIAPNGVVTSMIANGAVTNDKIVSVDWSKITNAPAFLTSVAAQSPLTGNGTSANPLRLINGTANEQVIKWTGSSWALQPDGLVLPYLRSLTATATNAFGVLYTNNADAPHNAVVGVVYGRNGRGVEGLHFGPEDTINRAIGVLGQTNAKPGGAHGVFGLAASTAADSVGNGVYAQSGGGQGNGLFAVYAPAAAVCPTASGVAVRAFLTCDGPNIYAFQGNGKLAVTGTKSFQIDHPLYPDTHYLNHFCAEGPEPYNIYSGVATLDEHGEAWIELPEYYAAINRDPRYHLTPIGAAMPNLHVAEEIRGNRFKIAGGAPNKKVSWEVKAIRNDLWVQQYGYQTVQEKPDAHKGKYLVPALYGRDPVLDGLISLYLPQDVLQDPVKRNSPGFGVGVAVPPGVQPR